MKKLLLPLMLFASVLLLFNSALAYNLLQLDITNDHASYDPSNQTIVTADPIFDVVALLNPDNGQFKKLGVDIDDIALVEFYLVASWNTASAQTFTFDGSPVSLNSQNVPTNSQLNHGELGSYGQQFMFNFDPANTTTPYNTQLNPGGFAGPVDPNVDPNATFIYETFGVNVTGIVPFQPIHFDLFALTSDGNPEKVFAPFSHDASAVPEPASLALVGFGLIGLVAIGRRRIGKR